MSVIKDVSFKVRKNELLCILGYSGCGKSTLLRLISQLDRQDSGDVIIKGIVHDKPSQNCLLLFQDFNQLFSWKTLKENVLYPMMVGSTTDEAEASRRAEELLESVGLLDSKDLYPHQLSGGMKQRGAVARALASNPDILLMDEPFSSLDATTRWQLQNLTLDVIKKYNTTIVFVTHSIDEATRLADRIVIMGHKEHSIVKTIESVKTRNKNSSLRAQLVAEIAESLGSYEVVSRAGD